MKKKKKKQKKEKKEKKDIRGSKNPSHARRLSSTWAIPGASGEIEGPKNVEGGYRRPSGMWYSKAGCTLG